MKENVFIKNSILKTKSNILMIIIIGFLLTMLFYIVNSSLIVINYINDYKTKSISKRELIAYKISTDATIDDIQKINNVSEVVNFNYSHISLLTDESNNIELIGINDNELTKINIIKGNKNIGNGNIICPVEFIPISENDSQKNNISSVTYNGNDLIDSTFIGVFNRYKLVDGIPVVEDTLNKKFKIIGTYNSKEYMNSNNTCYSSTEDIEEAFKFLSNNKEKENAYAVIVDKIDNLNNVKEQLESLGFNVSYKVNSDVATITMLLIIVIILFIGIVFVIGITIKHNIKRDISNKEKEMLLYKAIGYNNKKILGVYNSEYLVIFITSIIISILSSICSFIILKMCLSNNLEFKILDIVIHPLSIVVVIIIGLLYTKLILKKSIKKVIANSRIIL